MNPGKSTFGIWTATMMAGLLLSVAVHADFKRDYGSAVRDYNSGDYADAIAGLQKAIDQEPTAQEKVRIYGMRYEPYMPYFFLGQAKFKAGDCAGALAAWKESESQGVIQQQDEFAEMQTGMAGCKPAQAVDVTRIAQAAEQAIGTLDENTELFANLENERVLSGEWASRWQPEKAMAQATSQSLKQRLATAVSDKDEAAIAAIQTEAENAAGAISSTRGIAAARVSTLKEQQASSAVAQRDTARQGLVRALASGRAVEFRQGSDQMASLQQQLTSLLARGDSVVENSATSTQEFRELTQSITNVSRRYASSIQDWQSAQRLAQAAEEDAAAIQAAAERRIPPPTLKRAAEAYFAGNYQSAVRLADPDSLDEDRAKVQALLFRAAANYKLFVLSGEKNNVARQSSQDDIRAIKQLNSNFSPYIAAFSPRFLDLFRQTS
jgi:hypothetical protein